MRRDRSKFIGGSDVAAICGLSPYKTPLAIWAEKTGKVNNEIRNKDAVYWGNRLETLVAREWAKKTGMKLLPRRQKPRKIESEGTVFQGEVDFWVEDGNFLEVKTAGLRASADWGPEDSDIIPMPYYCQVQHYMGISGTDKCYVCVLIGGQNFRHYTIERDESFIDSIWDICTTFWTDHVLLDVPPLAFLNGKDNPLISKLYSEATEDMRLADPDELAHYAALTDLKRSERTLKIEIDEHIAYLKMAMGGASQLVNDQGDVLATWKGRTRAKMNWKAAFEEAQLLHPDIAGVKEHHEEITTVRTFLPKKPQGNDDD